ncbi:hypothetical protein LMG28138_05425 [Pararobbsia alpina]|uniref:Uncharacterized protein n=1 Tax=Pararobbsia alpina TaxID=621374 RepID=A0A6S7BMC5_9BURK|nr:hypothetical protein LMG28138_05425 [Pararobbsia alpina]
MKSTLMFPASFGVPDTASLYASFNTSGGTAQQGKLVHVFFVPRFTNRAAAKCALPQNPSAHRVPLYNNQVH